LTESKKQYQKIHYRTTTRTIWETSHWFNFHLKRRMEHGYKPSWQERENTLVIVSQRQGQRETRFA